MAQIHRSLSWAPLGATPTPAAGTSVEAWFDDPWQALAGIGSPIAPQTTVAAEAEFAEPLAGRSRDADAPRAEPLANDAAPAAVRAPTAVVLVEVPGQAAEASAPVVPVAEFLVELPGAVEAPGGGLFTRLMVDADAPTSDDVVVEPSAGDSAPPQGRMGCCCPVCGDSSSASGAGATPDNLAGDITPMNGNSEPWGNTALSGDARIDGVLWRTQWTDGFISYSDPDSTGDYQAGYTAGYPNFFSGFSQLGADQLLAIHTAYNQSAYTQLAGALNLSVEAFTGLSITYAGAGTGASTIRASNTSSGIVGTARVADFPGGNDQAGDVWFGGSGDNPVTGNYDWHTVFHELGHALGLKHGHDSTNEFGGGAPVLPAASDSMEYSIMTYRSFVGGGLGGYTNETWGYAQTWMMYDIAALQYMYGADFTANSGNTVYSWNPANGNTVIDGNIALQPGGNVIFATIWDGNGIDTYDLSAYATGVNVDLNPGGYSVFSFTQLADLDQFTAGREARGSIFNALQFNGDARSLIENAIGGSANDTLTGNSADNTLDGRAGADSLNGGLGNDLYIVDNVGDIAGEVAGGVDTVQSSVTFTLSVNLENLTLTGVGVINGTGNDSRANVIIGNGSANVLSGLALNDTINGGTGEDTLNGGTGNDVLAGESGVDTVDAGDGDDLILFTSGHFYDNVDGGTGTDTLDATAVNRNGDTFDFEAGLISGYPGGQTVTGIEIFLGGQGSETIVSDGGSHSYFGNDGDDYMIAEIGGETMDGGVGFVDTIDLARWNGDYIVDMNTGSSNYGGELYTNFENLVSGNGNDSITGTGGDNNISTTGGDDTVLGGGGFDTINGGTGNDLLLGGFTTDTVDGGDGDDILRVLNGEFYDNSYGGIGIDTLDHSASTYVGTTFDFEAGLITGTGVNAPAVLSSIEIYLDGSGGNTIVSDGNSNSYYGNGGDDYMIAGLGNETMDGGAGGSDTIDLTLWNGPYTLDMNTGVPVEWPSELFTNFENLISGGGNDSITGTAVANVISTNGGDDTISSGDGNDTVSGGEGNDTIIDTVAMFAGTNDDVFNGGNGIDTLIHDLNWVSSVTFDLNAGWSSFGGNRDQLISIENLTVGGSAVVVGSAVANVLIVNGNGANNISGLGGADTIDAGGGNDTVAGGDGNDSIRGGQGTDDVDGGNNDDQIVILDGEFIDNVLGGSGIDTLDMTAVTTAIQFNAAGFGTYQGSVGGDAQRTHAGIEIFQSGSGADTIYSDGNSVAYYGNGGDDYMIAGLGNETMDGGAGGTDTIDLTVWNGPYTLDMNTGVPVEWPGELFTNFENLISGNGDDFITGTGGANLISTTGGNDTILGGGGDDTLQGGTGNDRLDGGTGADRMEGGDGDDIYEVDDAGDDAIEVDSVPGGIDTVIASVDYTIGTGVENLTLAGAAITGTGNEKDNVITGNGAANVLNGLDGNDSMYGGGANDTLNGGDGNDVHDGQAGNDSMTGGLGDDDYYVDSGADVIVELFNQGNDRAYSVAAAYTLSDYVEELHLVGAGDQAGTGNIRANLIVGQTGNNVLVGLNGADTIDGGDGNDDIDAGPGADSVFGGIGDDTLQGGGGTDTMDGGAGNDLYWADFSSDQVIELGGGGHDTVNSTATFFTLPTEVEDLSNRRASGVQNGTGNTLDNHMIGAGADDNFSGLDGNDTIEGGAGNDTLRGGNGDDSMLGGNGSDTLIGNSGADTQAGGGGDDSYVDVTSVDTLTEFNNAGYDRVYANNSWTLGNNFEYLELTGGGNVGTGNGLDNTLVGNANNNTLAGLGGADTLAGRLGNDSLQAGIDAFQDRFVFDTALNAATNVDTLLETDFPEDQILLSNGIFTNLLSTVATQVGTLGAGYYFEGNGFVGNGAGDAIGVWYDLLTGGLYYNPTAGVAGDSTRFATVSGASALLDSVDFTLFAPPLAAAGGAYYDPLGDLGGDGLFALADMTPHQAQDGGYTVM